MAEPKIVLGGLFAVLGLFGALYLLPASISAANGALTASNFWMMFGGSAGLLLAGFLLIDSTKR
jgi:hypothetical protein